VERIERIVPAIGWSDRRNPTKYSVKVVAVRLRFEAGTSRIQSRRAEFFIATSGGPCSERLELTRLHYFCDFLYHVGTLCRVVVKRFLKL
jgi:hypothetical protein